MIPVALIGICPVEEQMFQTMEIVPVLAHDDFWETHFLCSNAREHGWGVSQVWVWDPEQFFYRAASAKMLAERFGKWKDGLEL